MATESADGREVSVTVPPDLDAWLDERAAALDVDRGELLGQLACAYRAAADLEDDALAELVGDGVDAETLEDLEARVDGVEAELAENVEDLRNRVLQLRDAVGDSAPKNHSHREFSQFDGRIDDLSEAVEAVAADVEEQSDRVAEVESRLDDADEKLTRVARAVVSLRQDADRDAAESTALEDVRIAANREGITEAACGACGTPVTIGLLTEAACPDCGTGFEALEPPEAGLGRALGFRKPQLRCADPSALEAGDE